MGTRRKKTTAGILSWTPAPRCSSISSSEVEWVDEDEDKVEKELFLDQMDENGIIGLGEGLEALDLRESPVNDPGCDSRSPLIPIFAKQNGLMDLPAMELSHVPASEVPPHYDNTGGSLNEWEEDEEVSHEEEEERWPEGQTAPETESSLLPIQGTLNLASTGLLCPPPQSSPAFLKVIHTAAEEIVETQQVDGAPFPEVSIIENFSEWHSEHVSHNPNSNDPHRPETHQTLLAAAAVSSKLHIPRLNAHHGGPSVGPVAEPGMPGHPLHQLTILPTHMWQNSPEATYSRTVSLGIVTASPSKPNQLNTCSDNKSKSPAEVSCKPRTKTLSAETDGSRKGPPRHRMPDLSKVEPRVHFPKSGYRPPKSKCSALDQSSAQPPLMFKSPADIVKEVLLCGPDEAPPPPDATKAPSSAPISTVPEDFRCPRLASTLMEQLQEDYNRLLTKYAEAENTIDRLRLEAKVQLHSDPQPARFVPTAVRQEGLRFMMLNFPQAQRAEFKSSSLSLDERGTHHSDAAVRPSSAMSSSSRSLSSRVGQQLTKTLCKQADTFLQQLQTFENLLKTGQLDPVDRMMGFTQLVEGLDSLERGYLMMRDEHRILQHTQAETDQFDPDRDLEELIFQCGMYVEDLKEQVENVLKDHPTCETLQPPAVVVEAEVGEPAPLPEKSPEPSKSERICCVEANAAEGESDRDGEGTVDEIETLSSIFLQPLIDEDTPHCQTLNELPTVPDETVCEETVQRASQNATPRTSNGCQGAVHLQAEDLVSQRLHQKQKQTCRTKPLCSSLTSLSGSAASERRSSTLQRDKLRMSSLVGNSAKEPSRDGIISPETDSGFVGSECSRARPHHQRATVGSSDIREANSAAQSRCPTASSLHTLPSTARRRSSSEHRSDSVVSQPSEGGEARRARKGNKRGTSAPNRADVVADRAETGTSECEPESYHTHAASAGQSDQHDDSTYSVHSYPSTPSPTSPHHHTNHSDSFQRLVVDMSGLQRRLGSNMRDGDALLPPIASTPLIRYDEQRMQAKCSRRKRSASTGGRQTDTCPSTDSEPDYARARLRNRHTQTAPERRSSPSDAAWSSSPATRCSRSIDEPDRGCPAHACPQHVSYHYGCTLGKAGGDRESLHASSQLHLCPNCGCTMSIKNTDTVSAQSSQQEPTLCGLQSEKSSNSTGKNQHTSPLPLHPVPLIQCLPVCSCQSPLRFFSGNVTSAGCSASSGVKRSKGSRHSTSLSDDEQRSLNKSLKRAIRAATHMKHTSKHMADSLATGLQHQELLTQSWTC